MTTETGPHEEYRVLDLADLIAGGIALAIFLLIFSPYLWPIAWWIMKVLAAPPFVP